MKKDHLEVLLEDVNDKLDRLTEGVSSLQTEVRQIKATTDDLPEMKTNVKVIRAAVTDQSRQLRRHQDSFGDHEARLSELEQAA